MAKRKAKIPTWQPIDFGNREWIYFDWQNARIVREVQRGIAKSVEFRMPDEFRLENGCTVKRSDTGELIECPFNYLHSTMTPRLYYNDFFNGLTYVETACLIVPAVKRK